jgi:tyrosyl-tRNA synthetase
MADLSVEEKLKLINENLAEVLNPEIIETLLKDGKEISLYWGTQGQFFLQFLNFDC